MNAKEVIFTAEDQASFINFGLMQEQNDYPIEVLIYFDKLQFDYANCVGDLFRFHLDYDHSKEDELLKLGMMHPLYYVSPETIQKRIIDDIKVWNQASENQIYGEVRMVS